MLSATLAPCRAGCVEERLGAEIREAAACALGCLSSFYEPGQLAVARSGAAHVLMAALVDGAPPTLVAAAAGEDGCERVGQAQP